jgi:hypothetical protein
MVPGKKGADATFKEENATVEGKKISTYSKKKIKLY